VNKGWTFRLCKIRGVLISWISKNYIQYQNYISPESLRISRICFRCPCMNLRNTPIPSSRNIVTWSMKVDVCDLRTVGNRLLYSWPKVTRRWARYMQLLWNSAVTTRTESHVTSHSEGFEFKQPNLWSREPKGSIHFISSHLFYLRSSHHLPGLPWGLRQSFPGC
jgi:hypothetical protein